MKVVRLNTWVAAITLVSSSVFSVAVLADAKVDSAIPNYEKTTGVAGKVSSMGSDTLANLMTMWAENFKRFYPSVTVQIQAPGSSAAPTALTEGTANFGPMSRKMKDNEIQAFEAKFGYKPTAIPVAIDALAVFVHKDNPIKGMTLAQVDAVFSSTRKCGAAKDIKVWGDAGLAGDWLTKNVQIFGRNSVSGTYGYFKETALCAGDYKNNVNEQPGSASVVQSVSTSINGIGYSGIGYRTASVRAIPLAKAAGQPFIEATAENAISQAYPLSRYLYVYVNKAPNKPLDPIVMEFIKSVLSKQGQEVVIKDGYVPLPAPVIAKILLSLK